MTPNELPLVVAEMRARANHYRTFAQPDLADDMDDWADRLSTLTAQGGEDFVEWLVSEMPPGTVIGDPTWWAPRILRAIGRSGNGHSAEWCAGWNAHLVASAKEHTTPPAPSSSAVEGLVERSLDYLASIPGTEPYLAPIRQALASTAASGGDDSDSNWIAMHERTVSEYIQQDTAAPAMPDGFVLGDRVKWKNRFGATFSGTIREINRAVTYDCELDDGTWMQDEPADRFTMLAASAQGDGDE